GRLRRGPHGREGTAVGHTRLQVPKLALEVRLQPAAVLALKGTQVIHAALKFLALLDQRTHGLAVTLLGVALKALSPGARVAGDLLSLTAGLGQHLVSLTAGTSQRLVRLAAGVGDGLVGGLLSEGQDAR